MGERHIGQPAGATGLTPLFPGSDWHPRPDLSDVLVLREQPWRLTLWEPLRTKAPAPPKAAPYCCYINTVIFYHEPYVVSPWGGYWKDRSGTVRQGKRGFIEWDQIRTRLRWDDPVEFEGEAFLVCGGTVVWRRSAWWIVRSARRNASVKAA